MVRNPRHGTSRRDFVKYTGASALALGLAGCSDGGGGDGGDTGGSDGGDGGSDGGDGGSDGGDGGSDGGDGGGTTQEPSVESVTLGSNHPLSGFLASTGTGMSNAIKLAAQRKNEAGGIESLGGATVEVLEGDNEGDQSLGGQVSEELIDEGANLLLGSYSSPVTTAATQVAEREQIPFVVSVAADDGILQGRGFNWVYRPQPPAKRMANDYADLVPEVVRDADGTLDTAGLFYVNNSYGQAIKNHLGSFLPEANVEVVAETAIEFGASSANTQVTKLKQADPDTIIATTYVGGGVTLSDALQNQDYRPPHLTACASATFTDEDAVADIGDFADGVMDNNYALNPTVEKTAEIRDQFQSNYDQAFSASIGMAYTAAEVAIAAIEAAGSPEPSDINDALASLSYEDHIAAMPPISFQDNGENANALAPVNQVLDGQVRVVYPEEFAETEPQV
jgi:branched-chain amino acid transport system substrate-binding protein